MQAPDPTVLRIRPALHHPPPFQPIDQPGHGDRLNFEDFRQLFLGQPGLALQPDQDPPLRPCHPMRTGPLIRVHAEQPSHIMQQEHQVALEIVHRLDDPLPRQG